MEEKKNYWQTTSAVSGKVADDFYFSLIPFRNPIKSTTASKGMSSMNEISIIFVLWKIKGDSSGSIYAEIQRELKRAFMKTFVFIVHCYVKSFLQEQRSNLSRSLICLYDMRHSVCAQFPFKMNFGAIYVLKFEDRYRRILFTSFG